MLAEPRLSAARTIVSSISSLNDQCELERKKDIPDYDLLERTQSVLTALERTHHHLHTENGTHPLDLTDFKVIRVAANVRLKNAAPNSSQERIAKKVCGNLFSWLEDPAMWN